MRRLFPILLFVTAACGVESIEGKTSSRSATITNGVLDTGHPAVALLELGAPCSDGSGKTCLVGACTATLVGPRTLLTAAHCLEDVTAIEAFLDGQAYGSASWASHPGYTLKPLPDDYPYPMFVDHLEFDIGIVRLDNAPSISPRPLATEMPAIGTQITIVGHGATYLDEVSPDYAKRRAVNTISAMASHEIFLEGSGDGEGSTCVGDSGGPALMQDEGVELVYGVASWVHPENCEILSTHSRVDVALDWLRDASGGDVLVQVEQPAPDTTAPQVQILSPTANATVNGLLVLSA
ncbi:MAG: trypsin-like serine protease, partial [Deltaproteobacteria bacterium]|nr:trypsin-like serine protease [Deltaproteobacteria bacterium]